MLTFGENSRLVIDQASFDPPAATGEVGVSLFDGILRVESEGPVGFRRNRPVASAARSTEWCRTGRGRRRR